MAARRRSRKRSIYTYPRYWYHVSTTLNYKWVHLVPREDGFNRGGDEPDGNRICVSPSIEQCITAIPYNLDARLRIYRTKDKVIADPPKKVFDSNVTEEGWLHKPTDFILVGRLRLGEVEKGLKVDHVVEEAASSGHAPASGRVLRWWKRAKIDRFIKRA